MAQKAKVSDVRGGAAPEHYLRRARARTCGTTLRIRFLLRCSWSACRTWSPDVGYRFTLDS